jgi:predicted adenylyl cyclase CyaB
MKKEIEILFELNEDLNKVIKKINKNKKIKKVGIKNTLDIYYYSEHHKILTPKNNKLEQCLRIRKTQNKKYITYKQDYFDNKNIWLYSDELETEVGDDAVLKNILNCLGYKELIVVENKKTIFKDKDYEICLEEVKSLGNFIEIEYHYPPNKNILEAKEKIREFIKKNDINIGKELNMGKPELLLRKKFLKENDRKIHSRKAID